MKILVRATNWVGDAVMSLPALRAIRKCRPEAEIVVLARPWVAELYRHQECADRLLVFDHDGRHAGFRGRERLARELRAERFDAAVLLQNAFEAAWLAWRAGIPQRIGYARDGRGWLLTRALPVPARGETPPHQSYYYLELLRRAGWIERLPAVDDITLRVPEEAEREAEQKLRAAGARPGAIRIAVAPGAAYGSAKCWLPERYAALADSLIAGADADVLIFGAPPERDMAERIAAFMKRRAINLAGATSIGELPALLRSCRLFVGNDSGAMHVAGAVGLPVVGIFGPTDPEATRPATPRFTLIREPVSCSPCLLRHCPIDHRCMTRISVEQVSGAARAQLERPADTRSPEARKRPALSDTSALRPAIFLDRDGTICEEVGYMNHLSRLIVYPWAAPSIRRLNEAGLPVIVVTNQSGVSRGIFPESLVAEVHRQMAMELGAAQARVDAVYYCTHRREDNCECRKPLPGLLHRAAAEHGIDLARSFVVGDRYLDVALAHAAGGRGIMVLSGYGRGEYEFHRHEWARQPDLVADNLGAAVDLILQAVR